MRKVLVVEDDRFIAAIFTMFLRDIGHEMIGRCQSGPEALDLCRLHKPDVVLMDIHLDGDWDGIQTADRITREFHIPVIFVSSDTDDDVIGRAIVGTNFCHFKGEDGFQLLEVTHWQPLPEPPKELK